MVLKKKKTVIPARPGMKPTRFRFKENIRLGFRNNKVVEVVEFEEMKKKMMRGSGVMKFSPLRRMR